MSEFPYFNETTLNIDKYADLPGPEEIEAILQDNMLKVVLGQEVVNYAQRIVEGFVGILPNYQVNHKQGSRKIEITKYLSKEEVETH